MGIVTDRNYGQLLTAATARRSTAISNIVYNSLPITALLKDKAKVKERSAGGPELRIPVQFDKLTAQWFTGYDKIEITPKEMLNSARFDWSRVVSAFSLTGTELLFTRGDEEIIDLMEFHINAAEQGVKEEWETSLMGDGTAAGGRQMVGYGGMVPVVPNTGVYGGIDRGAVANWRTSVFNIVSGDVAGYTSWDSTTARPIIERIALARSRGTSYADFLMADSLAYAPFSASLVAHQRIQSDRMARLGFTGISYVTPAGPVDVVAAGGIGNVMPANTIFGIDSDNTSIWTFPGQSFVPFHKGEGMRPINQDAVAQGIVWSGQIVLENPLFSYRIRTTS